MKCLIQRVTKASCRTNNELISEIGNGLLILVSYAFDDKIETNDKMIAKILKLRIFEDENNKMNLSVVDTNNEILAVSQFTLCANTKDGNRPSFSTSLNGIDAKIYYEDFKEKLIKAYPKVKFGRYQTDMQIELINDGPCTFMLEM